ncbi:MAG: hypothetical protein ACFCVK_25935 [Acidimicrobiales bacterium]
MEWSDRTDAADWWVARLRPFHHYVVGSLLPAGFDAVTCIFHPIDDEELGTQLSWGELAAANGRIVHAEMQLHRIASRPGRRGRSDALPTVAWGSLPAPEMHALASTLQSQGSTGVVWFGFSDIDATFHNESTARIGRAGRAGTSDGALGHIRRRHDQRPMRS